MIANPLLNNNACLGTDLAVPMGSVAAPLLNSGSICAPIASAPIYDASFCAGGATAFSAPLATSGSICAPIATTGAVSVSGAVPATFAAAPVASSTLAAAPLASSSLVAAPLASSTLAAAPVASLGTIAAAPVGGFGYGAGFGGYGAGWMHEQGLFKPYGRRHHAPWNKKYNYLASDPIAPGYGAAPFGGGLL